MNPVIAYVASLGGIFLFKVVWISVERKTWPDEQIFKRTFKEMSKSIGEKSAGSAMVALVATAYPQAGQAASLINK